jgi:hypothetical protein
MWLRLMLCLGIVNLLIGGTIVKVTNSPGSDGRLSDLVVYGAGGVSKTILKPGDASDDMIIPAGQSRLFEAGFEVTSYVISEASFATPANEWESILFTVKQLGPKKITWATDTTGGALVLKIPYDFADATLPVGSITIVNGLTSELPNWTFGTGVDFASGDLTGPYTGSAYVEAGRWSVATIVPEPSTLVSLGGVLLALLLARRRSERSGV